MANLMSPKGFFGELKRRNVYKVAVAYAIVGWLVVQIATQVFPFLEIPNWIVRLVIVLVAIGFPIALVIAWAFELTPEGLKRTEVADAAIAPRSSHRAWIYVVVIGGVLSIGLFFLGRYTAGNATPRHDASPAQTEAATATPRMERSCGREFLIVNLRTSSQFKPKSPRLLLHRSN